ncbi:MAG TPA: DUF4259 domain-containing protein [Streptomyces sp.]
MGTWGTGPFDNDTAADFGGDLDEAVLEERRAMVRERLAFTTTLGDHPEDMDGETAVAAAARAF